MKRKILVIELWGVGDLTFSTTLLREAVGQGGEVHLLGKAHARLLLEPAFPDIRFFSFDAPWTRFLGKYRLWRWRWREIVSLILQLRAERYDTAVSVRNDPRDHLLMLLIGASQRVGFATKGSQIFLTHPVSRTRGPKQHKVEDWRDLGTALGLAGMEVAEPQLKSESYPAPRIDTLLASVRKPIVCLHAGARIPVRRWPESYFAELIGRLRQEFDFQLVLIPDPDGYGAGLAPLSDVVIGQLTLPELVHVLGRADILLCNDSGPAHVASASGRLAIAVFGPTDPDWFRPWGATQKVIIRDICPMRPCFDYCRFPEPLCMTKLLPAEIWPEVREQILRLVTLGVVSGNIVKRGCGDSLRS